MRIALDETDVLIIGGGPAGLATAIALARQGRRVCVVEVGRYTAWRVGETLPAGSRVVLEKLGAAGLLDANRHSPSHAIYSAWGGERPIARDSIFNPYGQGWHLDRVRFDHDLAVLAGQIGVKVLTGHRVTALMRKSNHWELTITGRGGTEDRGDPLGVTASFLIDATGRRAWLAKAMGSQWHRHDRLVALVGILSAKSSLQGTEPVLMIEAAEQGWWYSAALPKKGLVAAFLTDDDLLRGDSQKRDKADLWFDQIQRSRYTGGRVDGFRLRDVRVRSAGSGCLDKAAGPGWAAVGDAACAYDPLSGQGLAMALESGLEVAEALGDVWKRETVHSQWVLEAYVDSVARRFRGYLKARDAYYGMERRWADSPFWRRRVTPVSSPVETAAVT